jgi:hypothetical protein
VTHDHRHVELNLRPSIILLRWVVILHICSSLAIAFLSHPLSLALFLQLVIAGSLFFSFRCWKKPSWHRVIYKAGCWELASSYDENGIVNSNPTNVCKPVELYQFHHFGQIYVMTFKDPHHRAIVKPQINILLLPDSSDAKSLRQFRQLLLNGLHDSNNRFQKS